MNLANATLAKIDQNAALIADTVNRRGETFDVAFAEFERYTILGPRLRLQVAEQAKARIRAKAARDEHGHTVRVYDATSPSGRHVGYWLRFDKTPKTAIEDESGRFILRQVAEFLTR